MKMRDWVHATYDTLKYRPAEERQYAYTLAQVEEVMSTCLLVLAEMLADGQSLRTCSLGSFRVETRPARRVSNNLPDQSTTHHLPERKQVVFKESAHLTRRVNR